ncbi:hypothetical protein [Nocardia farcinica]|uniref:hypothetical protein n=1 Tax=Nocardia farcinica TaxID=37329 RepID=UPI001894E3DB|nr:hypothetical protein [Nocardia farcinica]MBF6072234.1 hypothetical protein [Nocardia farcinica]
MAADTFAAERARLLAEGERLRALRDTDPDAVFALFDVHKQYEQLLPDVVVARCPFTGTPVSWPIDLVDLDGWYWDYDVPTRRLVDPVPPTWLAMGGAVRLSEPVTPAPFDCMPGPDRPYVVPRLLAREEVRAVVVELPIGAHTGWAITYFGTARPTDAALENLWGTRRYDTYDARGHWRGWAEHQQNTADYDFDLAPWLASGKLRWIAPGDPTATLREGTDGCPYTAVDGDGRLQLVRQGRVIRF